MQNSVQIDTISQYFGITNRETYDSILSHSNTIGQKLLHYLDDVLVFDPSVWKGIVAEDMYLESFVSPRDMVMDEADNVIPFCSGNWLYFLLDNNNIIYIGQTTDLPGRISTHKKTKVFDRVYCTDPDVDNILLVEGLNIKHHRPPLNSSIMCGGMYFRELLKRVVY